MSDYELVIVADSAGRSVESWAGLGFKDQADAEQYLTGCLRGDILPGFGRVQTARVNRVDLDRYTAVLVSSWNPAEGWAEEGEPMNDRPCSYCGPGPCRSTARTADGHDLELFERIHRHRNPAAESPRTFPGTRKPSPAVAEALRASQTAQTEAEWT